MDVNEELKFFMKIEKKSENKKNRGGGGRVGSGGGVRVDVKEELKFCENSKKNRGRGVGLVGGGGPQVGGWWWGQSGCERNVGGRG